MKVFTAVFLGPNDAVKSKKFLVVQESLELAEAAVREAMNVYPDNVYMVPDPTSFVFSHCEEFDITKPGIKFL